MATNNDAFLNHPMAQRYPQNQTEWSDFILLLAEFTVPIETVDEATAAGAVALDETNADVEESRTAIEVNEDDIAALDLRMDAVEIAATAAQSDATAAGIAAAAAQSTADTADGKADTNAADILFYHP